MSAACNPLAHPDKFNLLLFRIWSRQIWFFCAVRRCVLDRLPQQFRRIGKSVRWQPDQSHRGWRGCAQTIQRRGRPRCLPYRIASGTMPSASHVPSIVLTAALHELPIQFSVVVFSSTILRSSPSRCEPAGLPYLGSVDNTSGNRRINTNSKIETA